jgi:Zn-dependent peptidase ImmA (M78 family)/transcriptional regulator with XRE-family HTH domain
MLRVPVNPGLLRWARERAGLNIQELMGRFPKLELWEAGALEPTLKQLEGFANATHAPIGYLFLQEAPVEEVPIPDLRTPGNVHIGHPSPDLLDMVHVCLQRQEWYRSFARLNREEPYAFVGSVSTRDDVVQAAASIRSTLALDLKERRRLPTWTDALRQFISLAEEAGVLVMCSGVVLSNNRRPLDPAEFRGFALSDDLAPLVFVNGADTKAAQMFTLAHELAHIWLGQSAVSDTRAKSFPDHEVERWCNQVAAELLVPLEILRRVEGVDIDEPLAETNRLARYFKVSTLVILRRIHDAGWISRQQLWEAYDAEIDRLRAITRPQGGNFYLTQAARLSRRFARALVVSTLGGQTLYRDAFRMLGVTKLETFHELGRNLGVSI